MPGSLEAECQLCYFRAHVVVTMLRAPEKSVTGAPVTPPLPEDLKKLLEFAKVPTDKEVVGNQLKLSLYDCVCFPNIMNKPKYMWFNSQYLG